MDVPLGPVVSLFRTVRDAVQDRPNVHVIGRIVDHGEPIHGVTTPWIGIYVHLEVHSTGRQPVRVTGLGFELDDGSPLLLESGDPLPDTIARPETLERRVALETLRRDMAGRTVSKLLVTASPERVFRQSLPKDWRKGISGV